ncbi:trace amine-associated receptor 8b-like [Clytia hemisphaerica]|uniref:trace amine-associated receptor 8b-like n=1 Tax=Clytia hemisphaerica TaxID=252671 RepID=UPI0034D5BD81
MVCKVRMSILRPPMTIVYSVFFIVGSILATLTNAIVLRILSLPDCRSRSNKILISLAISDFLVGVIVFPMTAYQVLNYESLENCDVDFVRAFFSLMLQGSSCLTLAVISLDRYILMTKMKIYHRRSTKWLMVLLVLLSWVIPAVTPFLRFIGSVPYLGVVITIFILPFIVLCSSYFLITSVVKKQEAALKRHFVDSLKMKLQQDEGGASSEGTKSASNPPAEDQTAHDNKRQQKSQKTHLKLAKQVTFLLLAYFCCITPLLLWLILNLANILNPFISAFNIQNLYVVAMITVSWNSCINPIIYYVKNPEIRRGFRKMFGIKRVKNNDSTATCSKTT